MNMEKIKWILLGIFLILDGLILLGVSLGGLPLGVIAGICAIIAGVLFLINR
jgi:glucose dehydrogenase